MARNSEISDGVKLPISVHTNPAVTCFQKSFSACASSVENEDDLMIVEDGTENQDTPVGAASRGNISVSQSKEENLAAASEGFVRKECSDDDIIVISHVITPPRISLSDANRIKRDVRRWYRKQSMKQCAESSEFSSTQSKVDNSPNRLSRLSSCKSITTKTDVALPIQNDSQHTHTGTAVSSNIYQNAVLSSNTTVLSSKDAKVSTRSESSKAGNKPAVVLNIVRASTSRERVVEDTVIVLKNTAQDILLISEKNNTSSSTTVCERNMLPAASPYRKSKSTLPSEDCGISKNEIMSAETKKTSTSVTKKNAVPITTLSDQVAVFPSRVLKVPVDRDPCENFKLSKTSSYASGQHALFSGHKTSLSRSMPLQKKNLNGDIIPAPANSDMKRQSALSSEHSVMSPSEVCASVVPHDTTSESGKTPDKKATKKTSTSVTNKNAVPIITLSDQVAARVLEVSVDRDLCENFKLSKTSSYASGQHALFSGHKTSLSRPMPLQKKNSNGDIIPAPANSDMKRQSALSSEHSVMSPSEVCASVVPRDTTSESGKKPDKRATKKTSTSVTNKNAVPITTLSDQVAVLPSRVLKVPVDRDPCENFKLSETSSYASGQHALFSGHKTSLSRPMPLQKKNSNGDIIPAPANSDVKRQAALSSEHSVMSPSEVCASVVPHDTTSESGKTPNKKAPPPPGSELESIVNKLHYYMEVLYSDAESKENEPCLHSSDKGQSIGFTSTNTNTLVQNEKVVSSTRCDQSLSISVACKENTSTTCKQIAPGSPLCSNVGSKGKEIGTSPEVRGRKKSDCAARSHSVSNLLDLQVPLSLYGSSVPCVGNTPTTQKHNSAFLCSPADKQCIEPVVTIRKPEMTQLQSCTTSSISIPCKESTSIEYERIACGAPLCSSVENGGKETCLSPEIKRKKISDYTARKNAESVLHNLEVPGSSSGSSVACVGSAGNTSKQSSTLPCNTAGEDFVEPTVTVCESDVAQPQSQNLKLSRKISQHPRKYSLIMSNSSETLMAGHKTPQKRSPSKKLSKSSPINYVRKNHSPCKQMSGHTSANRALKFDSCDTKKKLVSLAQPDNQSSVPDLYYKRECVSYFESIITEVFKDKDMLSVLSEEEVNVVTSFWKLEHQVKKLYIRMLSRKYTWHRVSDIKYDDINVPAAFTELELSGLITSDYSSEKLEVLLNMMKLAELKLLCRTFRIPLAAQPKLKLINALMHYGESQQTISGSQRGDSRAIIKSRLMEALGHCIKLCDKGREGFCRIVRLFSLLHQDDDDDRETSKQLILLHYVKTGKVKFPTYMILKTRRIFSSREDLIRFEEANEILTHLVNALIAKQWDEAQVYGQDARERFRALLDDSVVTDHVKSLPLFIRRCTAGSVCAYAMTKAVEALKKHKDQLPECVTILQELLRQDVYLPHYRGKWYEELALILQVHLKNYEQAAVVVIEAMKDDHLNEVHQQMLSTRGLLLLHKRGISQTLKHKLGENIKEPLKKPPSVTIKAKSMQINAPGRKRVYIQENVCKQVTTYSSVEECAISHYKSEGYTEGVHDEGSTVKSLFGLIFWDIIYEHRVPDVFRSSYQREPLDLWSGEFYRNRKERIDKRLETLCQWDMKYVQDYVEKIFQENEGKESVVSWQRFRNLEQIVGLINCIGVQVLSKILERLVKNYRAVCSGFPDLLVWNPYSSKYKFVEVKGPGDRLSVAQSMWLNYLTKCNANAEVCHVETTGAKKQKLKMKTVPDGEEDVCLSC